MGNGEGRAMVMSADLRLGRWQEALADVESVDALIVDAPYSERTHAGHGAAVAQASATSAAYKSDLNYACFTAADVNAFVASWVPRNRGWFVSLTDDVLAPVWQAAYAAHGLYAFSAIACVVPGSRVRVVGDGPAQWSTFAMVARPRTKTFAKWGALDGAYVQPGGQEREQLVVGGKPLWLMRKLVRDYTRPGDLVCDPCAGGGTTLLAALMEGRRAIGAECMPEHYEIARKRLERGYTPSLFAESAGTVAVQQSLLGDDE